jgi:phosphoadenosine phosphosulfate reductase family protein
MDPMTILHNYDDGKKHIHVLSYGGGTQSTALLLMALKGEINNVIPDFIIFSDTGWEGSETYKWIAKVDDYIKKQHNREIIFTNNGNIKQDLIRAKATGERVPSLPFFAYNEGKKEGIIRRQCTNEYKILPVKREIRKQLGYEPRKRVKEIVHLWKGISTDEIQRVKSIADPWIIAEHPLIDVVSLDRSACIKYVEDMGLGTPSQSSCIGCPFHNNDIWLDMKTNYPEDWQDAVFMDKLIREMPKFSQKLFLHRSCKPLDEIDFGEDQLTLDDFNNECEGMCGV